ncbi:hypothetical protein NW752_006687 [Fusarium irregulare]|nr:hypothetical protein NW752_006687 [Fusarium irregulare]
MDVNVAAEPERTSEEPTWRHRGQLDTETVDPKFLFLNLSDMLLDEPMDYEKPGGEFQFYNILDAPATAADTLTTRIATLSSDLQGMVTNKPQLKEGLEHADQRGFFTVSHFHNAFIALFRRRYYHMPPIHWPTFHLDDIAPHFLLAVILTGTAYLQYLDQSFQHFLTASLLELAEKYIFKELKRLTDQNITPLTSKHMLEICQAAVLMHSLEGSKNHAEARRRIASKRIPTLVAVLRKTGIVGLEHPQGEVNWEGFIHRETCIRVVSWTFTNDSLMSLFCNHPPAMTVKEMVGHFPCSSELWDADSSDAFRKHMHTLTRTYPSSCHEAVSGLLSNEWASRNKSFVGLDTSNLFLINIGLIPHVFHCRTSITTSDYISMVLRALDRWDFLWTNAYERIPADERRWLGIVRYCYELIALSRRMIELSGTEEAENLFRSMDNEEVAQAVADTTKGEQIGHGQWEGAHDHVPAFQIRNLSTQVSIHLKLAHP